MEQCSISCLLAGGAAGLCCAARLCFDSSIHVIGLHFRWNYGPCGTAIIVRGHEHLPAFARFANLFAVFLWTLYPASLRVCEYRAKYHNTVIDGA